MNSYLLHNLEILAIEQRDNLLCNVRTISVLEFIRNKKPMQDSSNLPFRNSNVVLVLGQRFIMVSQSVSFLSPQYQMGERFEVEMK